MSKDKNAWNLSQLNVGLFDDFVLGELITRGALSVQSEFGLVEDGLAGPNTIDAILAGMGNSQQGETLDIPSRDVKDIERVYGKFSYRDNEDRPGAIIIDPSWARKNIHFI